MWVLYFVAYANVVCIHRLHSSLLLLLLPLHVTSLEALFLEQNIENVLYSDVHERCTIFNMIRSTLETFSAYNMNDDGGCAGGWRIQSECILRSELLELFYAACISKFVLCNIRYIQKLFHLIFCWRLFSFGSFLCFSFSVYTFLILRVFVCLHMIVALSKRHEYNLRWRIFVWANSQFLIFDVLW